METTKYIIFVGVWIGSYFLFKSLDMFNNIEVIAALLVPMILGLFINIATMVSNKESRDMFNEDLKDFGKRK